MPERLSGADKRPPRQKYVEKHVLQHGRASTHIVQAGGCTGSAEVVKSIWPGKQQRCVDWNETASTHPQQLCLVEALGQVLPIIPTLAMCVTLPWAGRLGKSSML